MKQANRTRKLEAIFARRRRLLLVAALCVWGAIWARAVHLQVINRTTLSDVSGKQSDRKVRLVAPRGDIVDRKNRLLAINVGTESFFAYPNRETSAGKLAARFASIRKENSSRLASAWQRRNDKFTWMARRCDETTARRIRAWELPGVHATSEYARIYPCTIPGVADPIGRVGDDLTGSSGLELYYDTRLGGIDGEGVFLADATGERFTLDPVPVQPMKPGARLQLTLDWSWQSILAEELVNAVKEWNARSGMAVLMDPYTGGIIAMVDYDPAGRGSHSAKSRLVSDVMEPGSTFKIVPFIGALSDGSLTLDRYYDGEEGKAKFSGRTMHDDKKHGIISAREVFVLSSNIGTGRIASELPPGRLDYWARTLGFSKKTGVDVQGESSGRIAQQIHSEFNVATLSIGHGVSVTPLQMVAAYATVANGGYLVRPHLVESIEQQDREIVRIPVEAKRVIRPEVALLMKGLMAGVVKEGTAKTIWDPAFPIAGKTGTAEKPNPDTKRYDKNKFIATFVGFYPVDKPRLVGFVALDEPQRIHYGGYTAAPVLLNTIRRGDGSEPGRRFKAGDLPDLPIATTEGGQTDWARRLAGVVAPMIAVGEAHAEEQQFVENAAPSGSRGNPNDVVACEKIWDRWLRSSVQDREIADDSGQWPDCRGMNLRQALAALRAAGGQFEITGSGVVVTQSPAPGSALTKNQACRLTLQ